MSQEVGDRVPQYAVMRCPKCGNRTFRFVGELRECHGPLGVACGHRWDPGEAGRRVVSVREVVEVGRSS